MNREPFELPNPPEAQIDSSAYASFIQNNLADNSERVVLALAMAIYARPSVFHLFTQAQEIYRSSRLIKSTNANAVFPSAETALFLLAGNDNINRLSYFRIFQAEHIFYTKSILELKHKPDDESEFMGRLSLSQTSRDLFLYNQFKKTKFSEEFPAHLLTTKLEWADMKLMPHTMERLEEVRAYLQYYNTLTEDWGMSKHAKPGCRILFHGDPGTGKTLAASLLGKYLQRDVYRVDISAVTSKYIGETSKRLNSLFTTAESKGWIIFFDEGDALFGQRKQNDNAGTSSQYANQDVAFLLQRIEQYDGIIIVATNFKNNLDSAFTRRFQNVVKFQHPDAAMQLAFWKENLPQACPLSPEINLEQIVARYSFSPASIINIIFRACILSLKNNRNAIAADDFLLCIKDEDLNHKGRNIAGM